MKRVLIWVSVILLNFQSCKINERYTKHILYVFVEFIMKNMYSSGKHLLHGDQEDIDIDRYSEEGNESFKLRETLRNASSQNGHHISSNTSLQHSPSTDNESTTSSRPNTTQVMKKKGSKEDRMRMRSKCNCDELKYVECILETKDLWDKFHDLETEMIITKTGRYVMQLCTFLISVILI